jgi:lysophospholipase L1-like esterase
VELGLPAGASLEPAPDRYAASKPIVFYGTSIVHGGAASRPGMGHPAIIGRMLDRPFINLGFGGNGRSEPEMARLLAELDPAVFVLDSLPNLTAAEVNERVGPFVEILREKHPATPVVLVENVNYASSGFLESTRSRVETSNGALRRIFDTRIKAGDRNLHYVPSWQLLGGDGEDTVDGTHPSDLGFQRMARGIGAVVGDLAGFPQDGFVSLFDGQTLSGWKMHDGLPKVHQGGKWWVEDGVVHGTQDPPGKGGFLWIDRPYRDYILKLEAKLDYPVDSGVFLRVGPDGRSHQVTLDYRPGSDIGAIYIPFGRVYVKRNQEGVRALRKDEWNDLVIRIEGQPPRIRFWLNGYLLTDFQHTKETAQGLPDSGGIALQVHPDVGKLTLWKDGNRVRFRGIRIKELPRKD